MGRIHPSLARRSNPRHGLLAHSTFRETNNNNNNNIYNRHSDWTIVVMRCDGGGGMGGLYCVMIIITIWGLLYYVNITRIKVIIIPSVFCPTRSPTLLPCKFGSYREIINSAAREIWVQMMCELTHHKIFSIQSRVGIMLYRKKKYPERVFD